MFVDSERKKRSRFTWVQMWEGFSVWVLFFFNLTLNSHQTNHCSYDGVEGKQGTATGSVSSSSSLTTHQGKGGGATSRLSLHSNSTPPIQTADLISFIYCVAFCLHSTLTYSIGWDFISHLCGTKVNVVAYLHIYGRTGISIRYKDLC